MPNHQKFKNKVAAEVTASNKGLQTLKVVIIDNELFRGNVFLRGTLLSISQ
jgi:hypothetical protein